MSFFDVISGVLSGTMSWIALLMWVLQQFIGTSQ